MHWLIESDDRVRACFNSPNALLSILEALCAASPVAVQVNALFYSAI